MNLSLHPSRPGPARDPDVLEAQLAPVAEDDWRDRWRTVGPWFASFGAHLGVLLLATALVTVIVAPVPQNPPLIPEVSDEPVNGPRPDLRAGAIGVEGWRGGGPEISEPVVAPPIMPSSALVMTSPGVARKMKAFTQSVNLRPASSATGGEGHGIFGLGRIGTGSGGGGEDGAGRPPKRVVFLVDASGSLVDTLPFVVEDLKRLVGTGLAPDCAFNVVFFSGPSVNRNLGGSRGVAALFGDRLEVAKPANIRRAAEWMRQVEAGGSGDPLAALKKAVAMDPDQIQLLSDNITGTGRYEMHQGRFMAEVGRLLAAAEHANGHPIRLKTYQFVYPDPLARLGMQPTLLRLVQESGGGEADYKFITARQLGLR